MSRTTLSGSPMLSDELIFESSATQKMSLGAYVETPDGRGFRYVKNGAVATVAGKVYQGVALDATNMQPSGGLTPSANVAIGGTQITISDSITLTKDQLAGGYMSVVVTPGQGYTYRVKGNTAVTAATGCVVTLEDPLVIAITTASNVIFVQSKYNGVVVTPTNGTAANVGVATYIIAAGEYGWIQTKGACACLFTGTGVAGNAVGTLRGGTEGSLAPCIAETPIVGYQMATGITGEYSMIDLVLG